MISPIFAELWAPPSIHALKKINISWKSIHNEIQMGFENATKMKACLDGYSKNHKNSWPIFRKIFFIWIFILVIYYLLFYYLTYFK